MMCLRILDNLNYHLLKTRIYSRKDAQREESLMNNTVTIRIQMENDKDLFLDVPKKKTTILNNITSNEKILIKIHIFVHCLMMMQNQDNLQLKNKLMTYTQMIIAQLYSEHKVLKMIINHREEEKKTQTFQLKSKMLF